MNLDELRAAIDRVDDELLRVLNERASLVAQVAPLKEKLHVPFYVPSRERQVVERLMAANAGPFPTDSLRQVFQEIMSACRTLERTVKVAYLGPEATFTHMAVKRQFGLSARAMPVGTIAGVFEEVERRTVDFGVIPVENSTDGVVFHTLDSFMDSDLRIAAEIVLEVSQCLLVRDNMDIKLVERVYSHPQGLGQCRRWLAANLPRASLIESTSTAEAARLAREDARGAAVASELAAMLYDLTIARRKIEDLADNRTRFLVLGREQADPTGDDKTSILVVVRDQPGVLFTVLQTFASRGINMTKIESRPSRRRPWEYVFFVDVDGHERDEKVAAALTDLRTHCESVKVLGSYPKADAAPAAANEK